MGSAKFVSAFTFQVCESYVSFQHSRGKAIGDWKGAGHRKRGKGDDSSDVAYSALKS